MFLVQLDGFRANIVEYRDGIVMHYNENGLVTHAEEVDEEEVVEDRHLVPLRSSVAEELDTAVTGVLPEAYEPQS